MMAGQHMAELEDDVLSCEHFSRMGSIIQSFACFERLLQLATAGVAEIDDWKIVALTNELGYRAKKDTLYSYMVHDKTHEKHFAKIKEFIEHFDGYSTLRNNIAHANWKAGKRPGSVKPVTYMARHGKGKIIGSDDNERDYTVSELGQIADALRQAHNQFVRYLREVGLIDDGAERRVGQQNIHFPEAQDIAPLAIAFANMMFAHAQFEREVRDLQGTLTGKMDFGEQPRNQLRNARQRPELMAALINEHAGAIPEAEAIRKILTDAIMPCDDRNHLAHGEWWHFDPVSSTIHTRGGTQWTEGSFDHREWTLTTMSAVTEKFKDLEIDLYKLRRVIQERIGPTRDEPI
jgi:hypothetical protein